MVALEVEESGDVAVVVSIFVPLKVETVVFGIAPTAYVELTVVWTVEPIVMLS